jgi:hypothetical protein
MRPRWIFGPPSVHLAASAGIPGGATAAWHRLHDPHVVVTARRDSGLGRVGSSCCASRQWVSTATIQVPIQLQLSAHGLSVELIDRLIETNFWLRRIPYAICAGLFLWMAAQVMGASGKTSPSEVTR